MQVGIGTKAAAMHTDGVYLHISATLRSQVEEWFA